MKPRNYGTDGSEMLIGIGAAHGVFGPDEDPEQRSGWREHYVAKPPTVKPGARPLGFGKPR